MTTFVICPWDSALILSNMGCRSLPILQRRFEHLRKKTARLVERDIPMSVENAIYDKCFFFNKKNRCFRSKNTIFSCSWPIFIPFRSIPLKNRRLLLEQAPNRFEIADRLRKDLCNRGVQYYKTKICQDIQLIWKQKKALYYVDSLTPFVLYHCWVYTIRKTIKYQQRWR